MTIGQRIKERRKALGLSAEELGKLIGKNPATIYRYEKGDIEKLPATILKPLAKALMCTPGELLKSSDIDTSPAGYYADPEVAEMANKLKNNPDMRILFDAAEDMTKDDIDYVVDLINRLKSNE